MAEIILTPADDIVADIALLSSGDKAILTPGTYTVAGNILYNNIEVYSEQGVIINATGPFWLNTVTTSLFTGHAVINSGRIDVTCTSGIFEAARVESTEFIFNGSMDINVGYLGVDVNTTKKVVISIDEFVGNYTHTPSAIGESAFIYIGNWQGTLLKVDGDQCELKLNIDNVANNVGNAVVEIHNSLADVFIGNARPGNLFKADDASQVTISMNGMPIELEAVDVGISEITITGSLRNSLLVHSDITIKDFTIRSNDFSIEGSVPVNVSVASGVDTKTLLSRIGDNVNLVAITESGGGTPTVHNDLTGRSAANAHPISAITNLQTTLDGKEDGLGSPATSGDLLASTNTGTRYWVTPGGGGVTVHNNLTGRSAADTHPISSITNLQPELDGKENGLGTPTSNGQVLASTTGDSRYWATLNTDLTRNDSLVVGTTATDALNTLKSDIGDVATDLSDHELDLANPHAVTKAQVGLSNVDNTSDLNKPVSTAQQAEIDTKEDALGNPATNGYILASTTSGVRSWVAQSGSGSPSSIYYGTKRTTSTYQVNMNSTEIDGYFGGNKVRSVKFFVNVIYQPSAFIDKTLMVQFTGTFDGTTEYYTAYLVTTGMFQAINGFTANCIFYAPGGATFTLLRVEVIEPNLGTIVNCAEITAVVEGVV